MKEVRLVVGEEDHRTEVGVAKIVSIENGQSMVTIEITNAKFAMLLGGNLLKGIVSTSIVRHTQEQEDQNE